MTILAVALPTTVPVGVQVHPDRRRRPNVSVDPDGPSEAGRVCLDRVLEPVDDAVLDDDHGAGHAGRVGFAGDLRPLQTGHIQALPDDPRHGAKYASARRACGRYDRLRAPD